MSIKQLYKVTSTVYVMAESEYMAKFVPVLHEWYNSDAEAVTCVPADWMDCIPFGEEADRTCREILRQG